MTDPAPTDPFAAVPGAVVDEAGVLMHLGNPLGEQRALASGRAVAPRADRRIIAISGPERLTWLDSVVSQAVAALAPGQSTELLILDPQGRIEHAASVIDDGQTAWLFVDAGDAEATLTWLTRMRFRVPVTIDDVTGAYRVLSGTADALAAVEPAAPAGVALVWHDPWPDVSGGGHAYGPVDEHPGAEVRLSEAIVTDAEARRLAEVAPPGALAGALAADALRIAAWRPRWAAEVDERALPHELDWLRTAVHLNKGCYRGQETVAKVHNLGHPPRRLVFLQLDGSHSTLPERGALVRLGDKEVGAVTSAALHYEQGPVALALIRRMTPLEAELVVDTDAGHIAAAQEAVVPPGAGATADVPKLTRLNRRPQAQPPAGPR